ncbi:MAG: hypothetical protein R2787_05220 [Saprospiraceae bacterium]
MGFIKNLKSLFIEEESTKEGTEQPAPASSNPAGPASAPVRPTSTAPDTDTDPGKVDQRFLDTLFQALEANNLEGFDYLEFRQALRSLGKMDMDEATRFKSAYVMAQTMNVTPRELTRTAQVYLDILEKEKKKFSDALANQERTQIQSRKHRITELESSIVAHQKQIEELMASISAQREEMTTLTAELAEVHQKIQRTEKQFMSSHDFLTREIESDIQKMDQYLK